ncbi:MAG: GDP-mannose pyrophosphatase NudK [Olleya marilimosa]|jgi:GDP-mannose pyrophosphatase NudK|uniref:NUDIX domain-containing protein n=1 Tax=Olleya marilimosa TaxID=272164 RepID=UPI00168CF46A|nr:NUDIX domain-containing protein [Olleya marilimosa]MBD3889607.1 NUDIX domain-containing protein [Olleya marilimosa]
MGNKIKNVVINTLYKGWATLNEVSFSYKMKNESWVNQKRESYDRGDGATVLLYNKVKKTVILTKQFRVSTFLNGNDSGFVLETCAGMLDNDQPEACIIREIEEETGYRVNSVTKLFKAYSSPGALTEILHYFIAEYSEDMKVNEGGGLDSEHEDIEVLEMPFEFAVNMITTGEIKDIKTICLLQYAQINKIFNNS